MKKTTAYCLTFTAPLHTDDHGTGFFNHAEVFIHSDTLSAAILSAWAELIPEGKEERFAKPPFLLSSAFPYFKELYFLPRPVNDRAVQLDSGQLSLNKDLKNIKWVEIEIWKKIVAKKWDWPKEKEAGHFEILPGGLAILAEKLALFPDKEPKRFKLWALEESTRVGINRLSGGAAAGTLFDFARVYYQPEGGLYFLARFDKDDRQREFEVALSWLGDSGLGSDRNCGHGLFSWKKRELSLPEAQPHQAAITLSLVVPSYGELRETGWLEEAAYELTKRGGWIAGTSVRKPTLRMFSEGSYFKAGQFSGQVVGLGKHPSFGYSIYRDGRGFFVAG